MTSPAHEPRGTASDRLIVQIDIDNVLLVGRALATQRDALELALSRAERELDLAPCGLDPVSRDAAQLFSAKVGQIKAVHWAHLDEVQEATDRLREAARHYQLDEALIEKAFRPEPAGRDRTSSSS